MAKENSMRLLDKVSVVLPLFLSVFLYAHCTDTLQIKDLDVTNGLLSLSDEEGKPSTKKAFCEKRGNWFPTSNGTELFCFETCNKDACGKDHKCVDISIFKRCVRTCAVDDDCEYPMKCLKDSIVKNSEEKFCVWKPCTKIDGDECEWPLICRSTFFGGRCVRRACYRGRDEQCGSKEICHPLARGCQCVNGMGGSNCETAEWCKENGKFKDCKGENGTCKYTYWGRQIICSCPHGKGSPPEENRCRTTCTDTLDCKNGGVCEKKSLFFKFCTCKLGLMGDMCETVFDCTPHGKYKDCENSGGNCSYDDGKAICECSGNRKLNDKELICEVCECGPQGVCRFVNDQKKCDCEQGFIEIDGTCTDPCTPNPCKNDGKCEITRRGCKCNCTGPWRGKTCETACICRGGECVLKGGKAVCKCPLGYGNFTNISCKVCDCGPDISCIWEAKFGGSKICLCKPGYSTKKGKCVACECGPDSNCEWISEGWLNPEKKVCHCKPGYQEEDGKCVDIGASSKGTSESFIMSTTHPSTMQDCHCGSFSYSCSLDSAGNKVCSCFMGYSQLNGSCAECNCGPHGTCSFDYGQKKCNCKSFAIEMNGICVDKQDLKTFCLNPLDKFP